MAIQDYLAELFDPDQPISSSKLLNLSGLSDQEALVFRSQWGQAPEGRRSALLDQLETISDDNAEADFTTVYRVALDDVSAPIRVKAIDDLWECQERWLLNRLVAMAQEDPEEEVRATAASALGKFVLMGVYEELRPALAEKVEATLKQLIADEVEAVSVRRRAIEALSPSTDAAVNDIIRDNYHGGDPELRLSAIYAMGQHCDPGWLPVLLKELKSPEPSMRYEAARACGELEDERAVPALIELIREPDAQIQETAIEALGRIGGDEAQQALRRCMASGTPRMREVARAALEEISFGEDPLAFH